MKKIGLLIATALVFIHSPFVSAVEPLDDTRIQLIRQRCGGAQSTMQRVLRSDTSARVNRGRAYEETIKLLAAFNSRAALNAYNIPEMIRATASFQSEFSKFKTTWIEYDARMKEALRIKCEEQPVTFYDTLTRVRELRAELTTHIATMNQQLDDYGQGLTGVDKQIEMETSSE